ncbi:hypothetical protein [Jannaschia sp. LMIT008]|uniref:hypothetical protein n=1 Tax=Jannaschia maritima TaxID=3032585 RepID=UPI002811C22D|nr:hypothetical protein [Jannaschia sp. LMIT008]
MRALLLASIAVAIASGGVQVASAQTGPGMTPPQAEMLRGIVRGFSAACEENCDAAAKGAECIAGCYCIVGQLSMRIDPATLPDLPDPPGPPTQDVIVAFVTDNRDAFASSYAECGVPIE